MLLPSPHIRRAGQRLPAEVARLRILEQHRELRRLLDAGLALVKSAPSTDGQILRDLLILLAQTNRAFRCHLAEEEALLLPILEDDVPVGPWHATVLLEEHRRQRAEIDELCATDRTSTVSEVIARYTALVEALRADMEEEERDLLTPDVIRDDGIVVVDQFTG